MMKKIVSGLLLCILLMSLCAGLAVAEGENLLANGGFESVLSSGEPTGWYTVAYRTQEGYTRFEVTDEKAHSGTYSAKITNANMNDARYVVDLAVKPSSMYRISAYVFVDNMLDAGNGANIAVENVYASSTGLYDTQGEWKKLEWYGETAEDQRVVQLGVRVGGYGSESQGIAYFDDVEVEEVDSLPTGMIASLWYTIDDGGSQVDMQEKTEPEAQQSISLFIGLALAFLLVMLLAHGMLHSQEPSPLSKKSDHTGVAVFALGLLVALAVRIWIGGEVPGYQVDMNCFSAWGLRMATVGPGSFYAPDYFCDYPPGYMLLLWPIGAVIQLIGYSDSAVIRLVVKSVPIICDMVVAILLFVYAKKRLTQKASIFVALMFAFNPTVLVNGAAWGQVDTVLALLLLLTAATAMEHNWHVALPLYFVSALMKPQAFLFAPIGGIWLIMSLVCATKEKRKAQWKGIWQGLAIGAGCILAVVIPFSINQEDPLWLIKLYEKTLSSYPYATLNTANLMYLLDGNWSALSDADGNYVKVLSAWIPAITGVLLLLIGAVAAKLYQGFAPLREAFKEVKSKMKAKEALGDTGRKLLLAVLCTLFGLAFVISALFESTFIVYGTMWMVFVYLYALLGMVVDNQASHLPFYMGWMLVGVYVLGIKIHERYLFAAFALLPFGYINTKDRRLLWLTVGLSVTTFINTAIVLDNSILFGAALGHLNSDTQFLNDLMSIANVLLCLWGGYIAFTGLKPSPILQKIRQTADEKNACYRNGLLTPPDARMRLTARDYIIMGVTVVVYSMMAFVNLGSFVAPQTAWVATSAEEQIVFELPQSQTFKLLYYAGISYNNFSVSVSEDGENWSDTYPCEMREGLCYRWNYAITASGETDEKITFSDNNPNNVLWLTGKYLRINADNAGLNLWEIILRDEAGEQIPLSIASHTGAKDVLETGKPPENLLDEQDTLEGEPGWYNGTYFDEIYHARTAYEHLHGTAPYETTHPPLGKLLMSVGIAIFGMVPFGWRFMGTLVGVLMLPALYLLAKQLTKRRDLATFAMLLLTFDLMHFAQTRIATIDSFPVLFIILSVLCMVRYMQTDVYAVPADLAQESAPKLLTSQFWRTLIPLALSGLFMGLSIASKWIGLYSAVGLALLFFIAIYRQFRTGLVAYDVDIEKKLSEQQRYRVLWTRSLTMKRILVTCAFCLLFFVAVPALIYYLSYIPYLAPSGPVTLQRIVKAQEGMLSYHSTPGLGMDHPFNSPWWQWPFILKPMWFNQDKFEPAGFASTIMCMGNPLIFYVGAVCMAVVFALFVRKYGKVRAGISIVQGDGNLTLAVLVIGFLAQYLPWVLVPRSMYIYHYFASVPFIILATMVVVDLIKNEVVKRRIMIAYVVLAVLFFAMFYPYASGLLTPTSYLEWLKWFPKIYY